MSKFASLYWGLVQQLIFFFNKKNNNKKQSCGLLQMKMKTKLHNTQKPQRAKKGNSCYNNFNENFNKTTRSSKFEWNFFRPGATIKTIMTRFICTTQLTLSFIRVCLFDIGLHRILCNFENFHHFLMICTPFF